MEEVEGMHEPGDHSDAPTLRTSSPLIESYAGRKYSGEREAPVSRAGVANAGAVAAMLEKTPNMGGQEPMHPARKVPISDRPDNEMDISPPMTYGPI